MIMVLFLMMMNGDHHHQLICSGVLTMIICSEVLTEEIPKNTPKLREEVQTWLKHKKIQGFYDVLQVSDFDQHNDYFGELIIMIILKN